MLSHQQSSDRYGLLGHVYRGVSIAITLCFLVVLLYLLLMPMNRLLMQRTKALVSVSCVSLALHPRKENVIVYKLL